MSDLTFFEGNTKTKAMVKIPGLEGNIVVNQLTINSSRDAQVTKALDNKVYINSFGNNVIPITILGAVFSVGCSSGSKLSLKEDHSKIYRFYRKHQVGGNSPLVLNHHTLTYEKCYTTNLKTNAIITTDLGYHFSFTLSLIDIEHYN